MILGMSKITAIGIVIAIVGLILEAFGGVSYYIDGIQIFPFVIIPIGILISLLGFMKRE